MKTEKCLLQRNTVIIKHELIKVKKKPLTHHDKAD